MGKPVKVKSEKKYTRAQAEKALCKVLGKDLFDYEKPGTLVKRERSGTTLVPESDKRPAAVIGNDFGPVQISGEDSE